MESANLTRFAWLSIGAAIITIALKTTAYWLTDSVGLLSDALESLVNLVAAIMALAMLTIAAPALRMRCMPSGMAKPNTFPAA
jgi:divalent metal cation (Fe/Co/Zn/Cd) transporter